jgi:hypothetical protein
LARSRRRRVSADALAPDVRVDSSSVHSDDRHLT